MNSRFLWVNLDKQEYLNPRDFYCSRGLWGTAFTKEEMVDAVTSLLAEEWRGDLVVFLEENVCDYPYHTRVNNVLTAIMSEYDTYRPYNVIEEKYTNIGSQHQEPTFYRFIINETRNEYIDRDYLATEPTPALLAVTSFKKDYYKKDELGCWIGEIVTVENTLPEGEWKDVSLKYFVGKVAFYAEESGQYTDKLFSEVRPDKKLIKKSIRVLEETEFLIKNEDSELMKRKKEWEADISKGNLYPSFLYNDEILEVFQLLPADYCYNDRLESIVKKDIDKLSMKEIATYLTAIDAEERFYTGCIERHVEDGTILSLFYRLAQLV